MVKKIYPTSIEDIEAKAINFRGELNVLPAAWWREQPAEKVDYFIWKYAIYVLPTTELVDFIDKLIIGKAIEIGSGNGALAKALGIQATDSKLQSRADIKLLYSLMKQPTINYPRHVEKLEGNEAVDKYKPDTVVGAFITHLYDPAIGDGNVDGINEAVMLRKVKRYIHIGNLFTHRNKPINKMATRKFTYLQLPFLITRSDDQSQNCIWVFDNEQ